MCHGPPPQYLGTPAPHPARRPLTSSTPTQKQIAVFWAPLAATWLMMSLEGPFLAAVIARLPDPTFNLAAHGVTFAFAILVESPVIMLMSASTALAEDAERLRRLRVFSWVLNAIATALLVFTLLPGVYTPLMEGVIGLPPEVAALTRGALWILLPWPAAIGYRRFLQGLLIRANRTRLVAAGTVVRLFTMGAVALGVATLTGAPGAWVGAAGLSAGVVVEAVAARVMAASTLRELEQVEPADPDDVPGYRAITRFYVPLALTSLIGLTVQPLLTFFMGRAVFPLESLAVFPVVQALGFVFRSTGLAFQEAAIALLGRRNEHRAAISRFALTLGLSTSGLLALVAFTPLAQFWFQGVSGLTPELAEFAVIPARILVPLPALSVLLSLQRAILVQGRRTDPITGATVVELVGIAILFPLLGFGLGMVGVTAAFLAFVGGRCAGNLYLVRSVNRCLAGTDP